MKNLRISKLIGKNIDNRHYRFVDMFRVELRGAPGQILGDTPDPIRTAFLTLLLYKKGGFCYILGPVRNKTQKFIYNLKEFEIAEKGNSSHLSDISRGALIHNIECVPGNGGKFIRSAGANAVLLKTRNSSDNVLVKLKSGTLRYFHKNSIASNGRIGNENFFLRKLKKAGDSRHLGIRPKPRAAAMNPVDHPLGGRTRGGMHPQNKNGLKIGSPTRKKRHHNLVVFTGRKKN